MARDFFEDVAHQRAAELSADVAEIDAGLARARAQNDEDSAKELIQARANANAQRRALEAEYAAYCASQQPRQAAPASDSEFLARSPERMTGHDVDRIFSKSKYYSKDQWNDPEVSSRVQAGMREVELRQKRWLSDV